MLKRKSTVLLISLKEQKVKTEKSLISLITILICLTGSAASQTPLRPDMKDGTIKWSYRIRGVVTKGGFAICPDNTIYAGDSEGRLYALNQDGSLKWELNLNPDKVSEQDKLPQLDEIPEDIEASDIPDSIVIPDEALDGDNFSHSSPTLTPDGKRFYIGGHTSGTFLADKGVHPKVIQEIMRHKDINLTMSRYTHTLRGQKAAAVAGTFNFSQGKKAERAGGSSPLSTKSSWPKVNRDNSNTGRFY